MDGQGDWRKRPGKHMEDAENTLVPPGVTHNTAATAQVSETKIARNNVFKV